MTPGAEPEAAADAAKPRVMDKGRHRRDARTPADPPGAGESAHAGDDSGRHRLDDTGRYRLADTGR
jgi:hypothetical protein